MIKYSLKVLFSGSVPLWSRLYLQPGHILNPQLVVEEFTFPQPFFQNGEKLNSYNPTKPGQVVQQHPSIEALAKGQ